jgi:hypothetical protein
MRRATAPRRAPPDASIATPTEAIAPVRSNTIRKLSERSSGRIAYRVGLGESGAVYLAVTDNEGGGYYSPEWVPLSRVRACLADYLDSGEAFATPLLRAAYRNRSVNNGGFLAAILRHEGLLGPAEKPQLHRCTGDWEVWERDQRRRTPALETEAETEIEAEVSAPPMDEGAEPEGPPPGLDGGAEGKGVVDASAVPDGAKGSPRGRRKGKPPQEQPDHDDD